GRPSLPRFPSLKLGASGSSSALPHVASPPSSVSTVSPVAEDEAIDNLPDHKEDIGNLTGGSAQQQVRDLRDDSISDWLPSQPTLVTESRNDALSLDGFQLDGSIFNVSTAESSLPSIELDSIDLDEVKSDSAVAGLSSGVSLEALVFDEDDDAPGAPSELADGRSAIRSGVQASEKGQEDLSEIDLDAAEPVSVADDHVESLSAFGIASDQDDLFASDVHDSGVARVRISVPRLDDIRQRHADLFAEVDAAQSVASDSDSGLSENSMLIQLSHLQNVQRKEKRRTMGVAVIVLAALVLFGLGVVIKRVYDSGSSPVIHGPEFAAVRGTAITADDLDIVAPVDDFALVMAEPVVQRSPSSQGAVRRRDSEPSVGAADGSVSGDAHKGPSATDSAIAAIYGTGSEAPVALPADGRRADGRANVVLQRTESFGSLDGAQGSRYAQMNSNSASSREMFNLGLRIVSQTVQECHRRESKTGSMSQFPKVYIQLTVKPNGVVEQFEVEQKDVPATFIKCLEGKKDRWIFAPFEGAPVKMRQGFILT
ncbi:MAG: hypothetical protein FWC40_09705, partial [Proteobacteria bacterium]|nr:hypothetical protein [Pseudomonadota bacterium]